MMRKILTILMLFIMSFLLTACRIDLSRSGEKMVDREPDQSVTYNEDISDAKSLKLDYEIGLAEFWLEGTDDSIISAVAHYDDNELKPIYSLTGNEDLLFKITQDDIDFNLNFNHPECIIQNKVNSSIPVDMDFKLGVGESNINLTNINVGELKINAGTGKLQTIMNGDYTQGIEADIKGGVGELDLEFKGTFNEELDLEVDTGVGSVDLDLSGSFKKDSFIKVEGGVGEINIILPSDVGIKIEGQKGLTSFKVIDKRMKINKDLADIEYSNDLFGVADVTIYVEIETGVGSVNVNIK